VKNTSDNPGLNESHCDYAGYRGERVFRATKTFTGRRSS
jgi:hypothetical protein